MIIAYQRDTVDGFSQVLSVYNDLGLTGLVIASSGRGGGGSFFLLL